MSIDGLLEHKMDKVDAALELCNWYSKNGSFCPLCPYYCDDDCILQLLFDCMELNICLGSGDFRAIGLIKGPKPFKRSPPSQKQDLMRRFL